MSQTEYFTTIYHVWVGLLRVWHGLSDRARDKIRGRKEKD